ncbi:MAG TPA: hypothetical protein VNZ27_02465 [Rhodanobacter sp.]|jgi:phage shock protein A|nr:hypothetical protein [Rhodanobacter sp.]
MHQTMSRKRQARSSMRKTKWAFSLALACGLFAGSVSAQWAVIDAGNIATNQQGFATQLAKTIDQYTTQLKEYSTQLQQYEQMISSIQSMGNGISLAPNQLEKITDTDSLIQGKCSGSAGVASVVSNVLNSMSSLMTQSITQTQQMLCAQIVTQQVDKYNKTVDMLNKLNNYGTQFQQMEQMVQSVSTQADSGRASTQVEKYGQAVQTDMADWQAQMNVDDSVISTLQNQQSILGHIALKGSNSPLGNIVQAGTFAAAFH